MSIPLYDDFSNPQGEFVNYDTYDSGQRAQLAEQKHVDIRSFVQSNVTSPLTMYLLDQTDMTSLDAMTMEEIENGLSITEGENWSAGTVGPQSDRRYYDGITLACTTGTNTTFSLTTPVSLTSFTAADFISLALPAFPGSSLTLASTYLDLTSDPSGSFATGPTDSIPFTASTTTLSNGDSEARFPLSLIVNANPASITGVRLRIQATASCSFRCLAIRALSASWEFAPVDQNTLYGRLGGSVPPTGAVTPTYAFPTTSIAGLPSDWPVLVFSDAASGPDPVDGTIGCIVHTGQNSALNKLSVYLRLFPMTPIEMTALDAMTMADLDAYGSQPDFVVGSLEDFSVTHYIAVTIAWGTSSYVLIGDQTGTAYTLTGPSYATDTDYYLFITLDDNSLQVQVYPIDAIGIIDYSTSVFDSTTVIDPVLIPRRNGRIGYYAQFQEGGTYIRNLRPRSLVYAEYRSLPLTSVTPVEGARLYPSASPDTNLYTGLTPFPGTTVSANFTVSTSGKCVQVSCDGLHPLEGFQTALMRFENFTQTYVFFDVLAFAPVTLTVFLYGENRPISLYIPPLAVGQWTPLSIPLEIVADSFEPGPYALLILQTEAVENVFYVDNLAVLSRAVAWSGRGQAADAWGMNDPPWVPFEQALNLPFDGAMLGRGKALQIRGQALNADAFIDAVKILPRYATLGNVDLGVGAPSYGAAPVASFTNSISSLTVSVNASASTAANGVLAYYFTWGDGTYGYGEAISHTYLLAGTYLVNLTVIDSLGLKTSTSASVSVS